MRRLSLLLALTLFATSGRAEDLLDPAAYLKILEESKLRYNILSEPSRTPVAEMTCPNRDASMRVVTKGTERSLVAWAVRPESVKLLQEGEVFYQAEKYEEAAAKFSEAIAADPDAAAGYLYYGDALLFGGKDPAAALAQYQKAIALDPTLPAAHFFASTAYMRLGRTAEAREEAIRAFTFHPTYETLWKVALQSPRAWNIKPVQRRRFQPPPGYLGAPGANGVDIFPGKDAQWLGYAICKAVWANEPAYKERHSGGDSWSVEEERNCVLNQLISTYNATEAKLTEQAKARGEESPSIEESDVVAALPPLEAHIFEVASAHLVEGYILFEIIGQKCPLSLSMLNDEVLKQVEDYIRRYLIVAAE